MADSASQIMLGFLQTIIYHQVIGIFLITASEFHYAGKFSVRKERGTSLMNNLMIIKGFTLVEIMIVVVIVGLLSAMAIPAFEQIRSIAQDNAVTNNLRQLSAAADQYYIEYGVSLVGSSLLVGTDDSQYIRQIQTVAGERYSEFEVGLPVTASGVAGSRTITYVN